MLTENPGYRRYCQTGKTPLENYRSGQFLWMFVDAYLEKHHPERFQNVQESYAPKLATLEREMPALEQAAA